MPAWLRVQHFLNLFFLMFIIRAGVQILADHPRLYWTRHCTPGKEWLRMQKPRPGRPAVDGEAGLDLACRSTSACRASATRSDSRAGGTSASTCSGCANGIVFYVLLVRERRVAPDRADELARVPDAASVLLQYLSLDWPADHGWAAYNGLQVLAYFVTVFVAAPLALITGLGMSPALSTRFKRHQQAAQHPGRAVAALPRAVLVPGLHRRPRRRSCSRPALLRNLNHIYAGTDTRRLGRLLAVRGVDGRRDRRLGRRDPVHAAPPARGCSASATRSSARRSGSSSTSMPSRASTREKDISPYFWHNGAYPDFRSTARCSTASSPTIACASTASSRIPSSCPSRSCARCRTTSRSRSTSASRAGPASRKWGGVSMQTILDLVQAQAARRSGSSSTRSATGRTRACYYDAHPIEQMRYELTMLAYDMNGEPLTVRPRRAAAPAQRGPARLQAGEVDRRHRVRRRLRRDRRRPRRLQRGSRVLRLPAVDLIRSSPSREVGARREPDEVSEVADQVRLIVVAQRRARSRPSPSIAPTRGSRGRVARPARTPSARCRRSRRTPGEDVAP